MKRYLQICAVVLSLLLFINHGKTLVSLLMPVIIALFLTLLLLPLADWLEKKVRHRLLAALLVVVPSMLGFVWILWWSVLRMYREAERFIRSVPSLLRQLEAMVDDRLIPMVEDTPYKDVVFNLVEEFMLGAIESLQVLALRVIESGFSLLGSLPGMFVGLMVVIVLTFFLIYDKKWVMNLLPGVEENISTVLHSIHGFIKVQFFLISVTAVICMIAFSILGIPYVVVFGATIAIFDLLPILGAGTLLIPMSVWYILVGMPVQGIVIGVLYIIIIAVRQVVEPRLLSINLGIHPIVAILCLFLGLQLFGVMGLVMLPLTASIAASFPRFSWLRR